MTTRSKSDFLNQLSNHPSLFYRSDAEHPHPFIITLFPISYLHQRQPDNNPDHLPHPRNQSGKYPICSGQRQTGYRQGKASFPAPNCMGRKKSRFASREEKATIRIQPTKLTSVVNTFRISQTSRHPTMRAVYSKPNAE